jgi:prolyl oligopeptidase
MSPLGPNMATNTGLPRTVRLWRRGTDPRVAPVIFETKEGYYGTWAQVDRDVPEQRVWFVEKPGLIDTHYWIGDRTGARIKIDVPPDTNIWVHGEWLAAKLRTSWTIAGKHLRPTSSLAFPLQHFWPAAVISQSYSNQRTGALYRRSSGPATGLILSILDDLKPVFEANSERRRLDA